MPKVIDHLNYSNASHTRYLSFLDIVRRHIAETQQGNLRAICLERFPRQYSTSILGEISRCGIARRVKLSNRRCDFDIGAAGKISHDASAVSLVDTEPTAGNIGICKSAKKWPQLVEFSGTEAPTELSHVIDVEGAS